MGERVFLVLRAVVILTVAVLITVLALPSPMRAHAWQPPRAPNLEGVFEPNTVLRDADRLVPGQVVGPESLAIDDRGRIYAGTTDGKIVRLHAGDPLEVFAETGGRPLGLAFAPNGDLIVADGQKGLLRVDPYGAIEVLAQEAEGASLIFPNGVVVAQDGTIFVTDSSTWSYGDQVNDILEANPSGRVIRYDPSTRLTTVLARGLALANGMALAEDESYLLVAETARYRIIRIWLSGERRHLREVFIDNLPGFPDNISRSPRGTYWVALYSVREPLLDFMHPFPFIKDTVAGLPELLRPQVDPYGLIFEMSADAVPLRSLHDPDGRRFRDITTAVEQDGRLYFGTFSGTAIGQLPIAPGA